LGSVAAGLPIHAQEHVEDIIAVPRQMVHMVESAFLLRVKGDSMLGDGIMPRDLVVVEPKSTANDGDLVVAMLGDDVTIKRLRRTKTGYFLDPSNPAYASIKVMQEDARIIGRVIGLIRDYEGAVF
jgi:repressor LexA